MIVCIAHGRFLPCRHGDENSPCVESDDPKDVADVRAHQQGEDDLRWA